MINFSEVEQSVRELKGQIAAGKVDQQTFEARLMAMIDVASDGYYWMFGHKSEGWYRHDGRQWIPDDPGKLQKSTPSQNAEDASSLFFFAAGPDVVEKWRAINWEWFIVSLIILGLIAWIIYSSIPA